MNEKMHWEYPILYMYDMCTILEITIVGECGVLDVENKLNEQMAKFDNRPIDKPIPVLPL